MWYTVCYNATLFMKKIGFIGIALVVMLGAGCVQNNDDAVNGAGEVIRLGYFANLTHAQALIGLANGTYTDIEPKVFNAGPAEMEALLAGDIDIAYVGPSPAVNSYIKSNGEALRIISGAASGGASLVLQPGLADQFTQHGPQALVGTKIASPQQGNTQDVALRTYLADNNLTEQVQVVPIANADQLTLFTQKELDGAWAPEPWVSRLIEEANAIQVLDERQLWPNQMFTTTVIVVNTQFLKNRPDLVKKFLQGHIDVTTWMISHPIEAQQLVNTEIEKITTKKLSDTVVQQAWNRFTPTVDPNKISITTMAQHAFALDFLGEEQPQIDTLFDLTILNDITGQQY